MLLTSMLLFVPANTDADNYPEEVIPGPPGPHDFGSPPSLSGFGIDHETGWNDTSFLFWLTVTHDYFWNETIPRQSETVQLYVDSLPYEMEHNNTRDRNWTDGKQFCLRPQGSDNRLWSKGTHTYFFYVEVNESFNVTGSNTFEVLNRRPYMLEGPFSTIYTTQEFEFEFRASDEDLDPLNWTLTTNMTGNDYTEFETEELNTSFKLKLKCQNGDWIRWFNVTVLDPYDNKAYWRWEVYCLENETPPGHGDDAPRSIDGSPFTRGEADPQPTADYNLILSPNAEGHELDWTAKGGGSHYVEVDDDPASPDDDATYVSVTSSNQEDYWNLEDHTTETGTITNVRLYLRVKHDSGGEEFAFVLSNGTTEYVGSDVADSTSWTTYYEDHATNPITSGDWYWGDIDYLQLGVKSRAIGGFTGTEYCTAGWIDITYSVVANTDFVWCGSNCNAGGSWWVWDDQNNWRDSATWTINGYPNGNDDTATFNETADSLYLKDGLTSVITIGELSTASGFTGTITFSIDLIIDLAGGKSGDLDHAAGTIDVNTSNRQINLDGNCIIGASGTLIEQQGTVIFQGGKIQELTTNGEDFYQMTVDTAATNLYLKDNLTIYKLSSTNIDAKIEIDAATETADLVVEFSDISGAGITSWTSGSDMLIEGSVQYNVTFTTADPSPPPTNRWTVSQNVDWRLDNFTASWFSKIQMTYYLIVFWNISFYHSNDEVTVGQGIEGWNIYATDCFDCFQFSTDSDEIINLTIGTASRTHIGGSSNVEIELEDSTFNPKQCGFGGTGERGLSSQNHNDTADWWMIIPFGWQFSSMTKQFGTGDTVEIHDGDNDADKFILDTNVQVYKIIIGIDVIFQLGDETPAANVTLTFDDTSGAGFDSTSLGLLSVNGTVTYDGMNVTSAGAPSPTNRWSQDSLGLTVNMDWGNASHFGRFRIKDSDIENSTFYDSNLWGPSLFGTTVDFNNNTLHRTAGNGLYTDSSYSDFYNVVITGGVSNDIYTSNNDNLEFRQSNFDTSAITLGTNANIVSLNHDDIANAYKIVATTLSKSAITNDHGSGENIEVVSGTYTIDEASASNDFTVDSGATLNISASTTHTFDPNANMTIGGYLNTTGANITTSSGYFDFYAPGTVWLNDSTVTSADLVLSFDYNIGGSTNTTLNDYVIEPQGGYDMNIVISSETYANKDSGIVLHMNASVICDSCFVNNEEFMFGNLTAGENYTLYKGGVIIDTITANATGWAAFKTLIGDSPNHLNLTYQSEQEEEEEEEEEEPEKKAAMTCDFQATVKGHRVFFEGWCSREDPLIFHWIWDFGDGVILYGGSTIEHVYSQTGSYNVSLEVIDYEGRIASVSKWITIQEDDLFDSACWLWLILILIVILAALFVAASSERKEEEVNE